MSECGYFLVYGTEGTELAEMVRVAKLRWAIAESFLDAKSVVGLDQYEVGRWRAWHRSIAPALLAHAYREVLSVHAAPDNESGKRGMQLKTSSL